MSRGEGIDGTLRSGNMANINRITKKALRVYEGKGLVEPSAIDPASGYHYFSVEESVKLDLIRCLQDVGISLDETKAILDSQDMGFLAKSIEDAIERIEGRQQELEEARRLVESYKRSCESLRGGTRCGQISLAVLPERLALAFPAPPCESHLGGQSPFDERERWEWLVRHARTEMADAGLPVSLAHRLGFVVSPERIGKADSWMDCVIVPVDEPPEGASGSLVTFPGGCHLVVYYDSFEAAPQDSGKLYLSRVVQLLDHAKTRGLEVAGSLVCEEMCRFPRLLDAKASSLHRYCLPVSSKADPAS